MSLGLNALKSNYFMSVSVCMATYNGSKFIKKQIDSILSQLSENDEFLILDDCSTDDTFEILSSYNDNRIKLYRNTQNLSHVLSFSKVLSLANCEILIMADQDDIWVENRKSVFENSFFTGKFVVSSNSIFINENDDEILFKHSKLSSADSRKHFKNILNIFLDGGSYVGCTMALHRDFLKIVLPIPTYVESHDLWIALASNIFKSNLHLDDITLKRRIHSNNASIIKRKILFKLWSRVIFTISIIHIYIRMFFSKK